MTKTLLFLGLSPQDGPVALTAYDKATGAVVGGVELPARPIGTPMTYVLEGKQYIALTVGMSLP